MSRQEKKTRIRVVPPKLQLRGQDALTGSYPTNVRFSLDGRTGNYKVNYNDVQTIVFGTRSNGTAWQDNLVGYWTMQRLGPTGSSVGNVTFESELSGSIGNGIFPFLDYNSARLASKYFTSIGVSQSYGHYGKGYDVNLYNASPVAPIKTPNTFPYLEPNKSYDFNPYFSAYGIMKADPALVTSTDSPLLIQNLDADKTLFEFSNFTGPYPKGHFDQFTVAGWFYYSSSNQNAVNSHILVAGPCRKDPWGVEYVDYYAGAIEDGAGGLKFQVSFISSSYSADSIQLDTDSVPDLVGKWYHFAFTYNGRGTYTIPAFDINSIKVYANGKLVNPNAISANGGGFNGYNTGTAVELGLSSGYLFGLNANITGSIGELAVFDRVLTADEIAEIYYSQVPLHKKRRVIAGTSVDLDNDPYPVDAGEYMTTFNRDGMLVTGSIVKGVGDNPQWVHFSPGQEMQPFMDQQQFAADAKGASVQNSFFATGSAETLVGEGFNSPLWSKNKIDIDISFQTPISLSLNKGKFSSGDSIATSDNSPMAYYNFNNKRWEKIGIGLELDNTSLRNYLNYLPIGFFNGFMPLRGSYSFPYLINSYLHLMGNCAGDFGFPYHPKFHATGSQTIKMSDYITEPFLLEKMVLEVSASWYVGDINLSVAAATSATGSVSTFFLLNQRKNQNITYEKSIYCSDIVGAVSDFIDVSASVPTNYALTPNDYATPANWTYVSTVRDIIGFSQIYSFTSGALDTVYKQSAGPIVGLIETTSSLGELLPISSNDVLLLGSSTGISGANWTKHLVLSMSAGAPSFTQGPNNMGNYIITRYKSVGTEYDFPYVGFDGSRTGLGFNQLSTRGLTNDLFSSTNREPGLTNAYKPYGLNWQFPQEKSNINPYLLYPEDELILGCQAPVSQLAAILISPVVGASLEESVLVLKPGEYKMTLYGSYIREGKEYNDGTNQLLSSDGIHEVIE